MKLLLDTDLLLWAAGTPDRLSESTRQRLGDSQNTLLFSAASIWEVASKRNLGREEFNVDARLLRRGLLDNGYQELVISSEHAAFVVNLPPIHKDPSDRILIAQAIVEGISLLTSDTLVGQYSGPIFMV